MLSTNVDASLQLYHASVLLAWTRVWTELGCPRILFIARLNDLHIPFPFRANETTSKSSMQQTTASEHSMFTSII